MDDPRVALLSNIVVESCRVELSASPVVLLCGGKVNNKLHPDDPDPEIASLRHAITTKNTDYELFRPEEITTWQSDAIFKNLMDFEKDLASICTLVVIILESAGSIAELGAFSQLSDLSKKLIVITSDEFNLENSFIKLGILRHIKNNHESSIKNYPWKINSPSTISKDVIDDVIQDIKNEIDNLPGSNILKLDIGTHIIVLICELIKLFVALKHKEILKYLRDLGVDISDDDLKGKLFLLIEFKLIKREQYSDSFFYVRTKEIYHKLRISVKQGAKLDPIRMPVECIEYYKESNDRHRSQIIKKLLLDGEE